MQKAAAAIAGLLLLAGFNAPSFGQESSERAFAYSFSPSFHLTVIHIQSGRFQGDRWISGFASGVGSFYQRVPDSDISIDFLGGKATANTTVSTSLGTTIPIAVTWSTSTGGGLLKTLLGMVSNLIGNLFMESKETAVTGSVGSFTIGAAYGEISRRSIVQ